MPVALLGKTGICSPLITHNKTLRLDMLLDDGNKGLLVSSLYKAKNGTSVCSFDLEYTKHPRSLSFPGVTKASSSILPKNSVNIITKQSLDFMYNQSIVSQV